MDYDELALCMVALSASVNSRIAALPEKILVDSTLYRLNL